MGYQKQLWGNLHYLVLLVLQEVTVGHIACGRLHITEYVFPDGEQESQIIDAASASLDFQSS